MEEKNGSPWEYHGYDPDDIIQKCLNCPMPYCNNCLESKKDKGRGSQYSIEEIEALKDLKLSNKELAVMLKRKEGSVRDKRKELSIVGYKDQDYKKKYKWTPEMDAYLIDHKPSEAMEKFGINANACNQRRFWLRKKLRSK